MKNHCILIVKGLYLFVCCFSNKGGKTCFTQGGVNQYYDIGNPHRSTELKLMTADRVGYYGWVGYGGSVMQWHPELKIGFGYVPSLLQWYDAFNTKGARMQKLVVDCAQAAAVKHNSKDNNGTG